MAREGKRILPIFTELENSNRFPVLNAANTWVIFQERNPPIGEEKEIPILAQGDPTEMGNKQYANLALL